jgi:predicted amidohydrolase YtcJ
MRTLWHNGTFYSMKRASHFYRSIVTENGLIVAVDENKSPAHYDRVIDCEGAWVFPGFVDAHLHILGFGERLTLPNVQHLSQKNEILKFMKTKFMGQPLLVQGYHEVGITAQDLDNISSSIPIVLRHHDYHGATVNSAKLKELKFTSSDGILKEEEANRAVYSFPKYPVSTLTQMIQNAFSTLHAYGVTGGHSDDLYYFNGFFDTLRAFERALETKPFRTHLLMHHLTLDDYLKSKRPWLDQNPFLQLGAVKMFYDGTLTSKTALMTNPYFDGSFGQRIDPKTTWENRLKAIRKLGLPVAIHVIGDQGLDEVADSLTKYPVKQGLHDRIIHASFAKKETLAKLKRLSVIFDIQPQFLTSDFPEGFALFLKPPALIYAWKTYSDHGLVLCGSSDAPVEIPNPLLGIYQAVYRQKSYLDKVLGKEEKISMFDAISLYTTRANIPTYHVNRGMIDIGFIADFTMLNQDPFQVSQEQWTQLQVTQTIINEQQVYKK